MNIKNILKYSEIFYKKALWSYFLVKSGAINPLMVKLAADKTPEEIINELKNVENLFIRSDYDLAAELKVLRNMYQEIINQNKKDPTFGGYAFLNEKIRATANNNPEAFEADEEEDEEDMSKPLSKNAVLLNTISDLQSDLRIRSNQIGKSLKDVRGEKNLAQLLGFFDLAKSIVDEEMELISDEEAEHLEELEKEKIASGESRVVGAEKLSRIYERQLNQYKNILDFHKDDFVFSNKMQELIDITSKLKVLVNEEQKLITSISEFDFTTPVFTPEDQIRRYKVTKEKEDEEKKIKSIREKLNKLRADKKRIWDSQIKPVLRNDANELIESQLKDQSLSKIRRKILEVQKELNINLNKVRDKGRTEANELRKELLKLLTDFESNKNVKSVAPTSGIIVRRRGEKKEDDYQAIAPAVIELEAKIAEAEKSIITGEQIAIESGKAKAKIRSGEEGKFQKALFAIKENIPNTKMGIKKEWYAKIESELRDHVRSHPACDSIVTAIAAMKKNEKTASLEEKLQIQEEIKKQESQLRDAMAIAFPEVLSTYFEVSRVTDYYEGKLKTFVNKLLEPTQLKELEEGSISRENFLNLFREIKDLLSDVPFIPKWDESGKPVIPDEGKKQRLGTKAKLLELFQLFKTIGRNIGIPESELTI